MSRSVHLRLVLVSILMFVAFATRAVAQVTPTGMLPTQAFDPSIEAAGMGGASIAAFWEENPNDHANPALMGFHKGLRYSYGTTHLIPEIAEDVHYVSHRILAGAWGIGVAMSGKPVESVGYVGINYGPTTLTDVNGNDIGEVEATEHVRSIAVGVSVFDVISSIRVAKGGEPLSLDNRVSLALGHAWKTYDVDFGSLGGGEGSNNDAGILLRVAPFDQIGNTLRDANDRLRWKVDVAGAYTRLDYLNDRTVDYSDTTSDDLFERRSVAGSVQFTMALPNDGTGDLWDFAIPSIRLGATYENADVYLDGDKLGTFAKRYGAELSVLDMLYLRYGHVKGEGLGIDDVTFGGGIQLKYRNMIGVKGDYASYPRVSFFTADDTYERWGLTFFVDPYRLLKKRAD